MTYNLIYCLLYTKYYFCFPSTIVQNILKEVEIVYTFKLEIYFSTIQCYAIVSMARRLTLKADVCLHQRRTDALCWSGYSIRSEVPTEWSDCICLENRKCFLPIFGQQIKLWRSRIEKRTSDTLPASQNRRVSPRGETMSLSRLQTDERAVFVWLWWNRSKRYHAEMAAA